jgi:hypothetical protein
MAIFEGPDRNRNIMITAAAVVIAVFAFLYATGLVPGGDTFHMSTGTADWTG